MATSQSPDPAAPHPHPRPEPRQGLFSQQNCLQPSVLTARWNFPRGGRGLPGLTPTLCCPHSSQPSLRNSAGHSLGTKLSSFDAQELRRREASIWPKAPERVSDPTVGCAWSSTKHPVSRPASTHQGDERALHPPAHTHTFTHVCTGAHVYAPALHLLHSAHGVPCLRLPAKSSPSPRRPSTPSNRGPEAARAACLL